MLLDKNRSCLLLVDVQEKLTPFVQFPEKLIAQCSWLLRLANNLGVTVQVTEQYPKGLGRTCDALQHLIKASYPLEKVTFSCWRSPNIRQELAAINKNQIVLIGIETHVCILQTAIDLVGADYEVFVVIDAVSSRSVQDNTYALKRMKQMGIQLLTSEMVFFEWVESAGTVEFKSLSAEFLKK